MRIVRIVYVIVAARQQNQFQEQTIYRSYRCLRKIKTYKNSIHEIAPEPYEMLSLPHCPVQLDILS